jgi:AraC-like DNA-binding protein
MKPFLEKLNLVQENSFYVKTHCTPLFEVGWHQHPELELIYFREGFGNAFIGDYVGDFTKNDVYFIGSDVAHTFQKANEDLYVNAVVIQFREDFWGYHFLNLPECKRLKKLFEKALHGLKIGGNCREQLILKIIEMEKKEGLQRVINLIECLQIIDECREVEVLSTLELKDISPTHKERIEKVYHFTLENYFEPITLERVAGIAAMSIPAFCAYFKRGTRKTYIEFLNEVRIENACRLLIESEKSIHDIGFNSGFNSLPNFNKQFYKVKKMTPSQYRKMFERHVLT